MIIRRSVAVLGLAAVATCSDFPNSDEPRPVDSTEIESVEQELGTGGTVVPDGPCQGGGATQCSGFGHCCPGGYGMQGVYLANNTFLCRAVIGADPNGAGCYIDRTSQRTVGGVTMKGCPVGHFMRGYNNTDNTTLCCPYPSSNQASAYFLDGTQSSEYKMAAEPLRCGFANAHTCYSDEIMEGIHAANNHLLCAD